MGDGDGDGPFNLPRALRVDLDGRHGTVPLPAWPEEIVALALDERSGISEDELLAFALGVRFLAFAGPAQLRPLATVLRVPSKHRSTARSQVWLVQHWPWPLVQTHLLVEAVRVALAVGAAQAEEPDGPSPRFLLRRLVDADHSREVARAAGALISACRSNSALPALVWSLLRTGNDAWREAAARIARNPRVEQARTAVLASLDGSAGLELRSVLAGLYLLSADRKVRATSRTPEVQLASLEHDIRMLQAQVEELTRERDRLQAQVEDLEAENREWFGLYTAPARGRPETPDETPDPPLRGLRVVIAGDPQHAQGYQGLCIKLGAAHVEVLDAVSDSATRIATRMEAADLPVLVTAWASHKTQMAIEARLPRRDLILVHTAGLHAMRTVLVEAAGRLPGPSAALTPPG